jgi:hypothetical protein
MTLSIAGVAIPDTALIRATTELIRTSSTELLFHHSRRVFLFGTLQGRCRGISAHPELLYVGAMFHDLGLTAAYHGSGRRFEVDGADAASDFLLSHGRSAAEARDVWLAIALHTTPGIPGGLEPEIELVTAGVETDVLGLGLDDLDPDQIAAVTAAHPRPDFKEQILRALTDGMRRRPQSTFGTMNDDVLAHFVPGFTRPDFVDLIRDSAWPD